MACALTVLPSELRGLARFRLPLRYPHAFLYVITVRILAAERSQNHAGAVGRIAEKVT